MTSFAKGGFGGGQKAILHDKGGGGIYQKVICMARGVRVSDKKCCVIPTKSGKFVSLSVQELLRFYEATLGFVIKEI